VLVRGGYRVYWGFGAGAEGVRAMAGRGPVRRFGPEPEAVSLEAAPRAVWAGTVG